MRFIILAALLVAGFSTAASAQAPPEPREVTEARLGPAVDGALRRIKLRPNQPSIRSANTPSQALNMIPDEGRPDPLLMLVGPNYRVGPGDILNVQFEIPNLNPDPKAVPAKPRRVVGADGTIVVDTLRIDVDGLTMAQVERVARRQLSRFYHNFRLNISLESVRRFPVNVTGQVSFPGSYLASGATGAAELVLDAGGLTDSGSIRRVQVLDEHNRVVKTLDFLRWQSLGDETQNPVLRPNQSLLVPSVDQEVQLSGEVRNPGIYEILPGETVADLLRLAGGMTNISDLGKIQIGRLDPDGKRKAIKLDLTSPDSPDWRFALRAGDQFQAYDLTLAQGRVLVMGEVVGKDIFPPSQNAVTGQFDVQKRGVHRLQQGETVRDLLLAIGGPTPKADMHAAWLERAGPDGSLIKIPLNLQAMLSGPNPETQDVALQDGDTLVVPALPDNVFMAGHFYKPGPIPYTPGWGLREYIAAAGGTTDQASTKHARLVRKVPDGLPVVYAFDALDVLGEGVEVIDEVRPGDVIYLPLYKPFYQDFFTLISNAFIFTALFR